MPFLKLLDNRLDDLGPHEAPRIEHFAIPVAELRREKLMIIRQSALLGYMNYLVLYSLSDHCFSTAPPSRMVPEPNVGRSGLVPQLVGDDLHLVLPDDSNTTGRSSQVDADSHSLHLDLHQIGNLIQ